MGNRDHAPESPLTSRKALMCAEEINEAIDTLRQRVLEVEELKHESFLVREAVKEPTERHIRDSIMNIFGRQSWEFQTHALHRIDVSSEGTIEETVALLHELIRTLEARLLGLFGVQTTRILKSVVIDPLTGLDGRGRFEDSLTKELNRSARQSAPFTVGRFAVRNLTDIRKTYGIETEEQILLRFARACKASLRTYDHASRTDHAEFGILLPDAQQLDTHVVIHRVSARFAQDLRSLMPPTTLRVEFGTASFPFDAETASMLFEAALPQRVLELDAPSAGCAQGFS